MTTFIYLLYTCIMILMFISSTTSSSNPSQSPTTMPTLEPTIWTTEIEDQVYIPPNDNKRNDDGTTKSTSIVSMFGGVLFSFLTMILILILIIICIGCSIIIFIFCMYKRRRNKKLKNIAISTFVSTKSISTLSISPSPYAKTGSVSPILPPLNSNDGHDHRITVQMANVAIKTNKYKQADEKRYID
eukprot:UN08409